MTPPADRTILSRWNRPARAACVCALAVYLASGFYFVQPDERGVVRRFGKIPHGKRAVEPGLHYAMPWPVCRVDCPKTTEVRRIHVGLRPDQREAIARGEPTALADSPATDVLTGDNNILKISMIVQYQVSDAAAYLTATRQPDALVRNAVEGIVVQTLATLPVDQALTTGKVRLQEQAVRQAQARLEEYGCGVRLVGARLESIEPPAAVADAFKDVVSAKKDGERLVDQATGEANAILPQARGEAVRTVREAEAYGLSRVGRARGESDRFLSLLAEYRKAPRVTRDRLRLQAFERILPRVRVRVLDDKPDDPPTHLRIIEAAPEK